MANKTKMTKADYFKQISEGYPLTDAEQAFIAHELELLAKKSSGEKKPTAQQVENQVIKTAMLDGMESGKAYTITDLIKTVPACADLTNQRVSALMRQMVESGAVVRTEDKRKAYFTKVD